MEPQQLNWIANFIWGIADARLLRGQIGEEGVHGWLRTLEKH
jgi:hypothetical protein